MLVSMSIFFLTVVPSSYMYYPLFCQFQTAALRLGHQCVGVSRKCILFKIVHPPMINIEPENDGLEFGRLSSNGCISMVMLVFGGVVIALICFDNITRITIFSAGDSYEPSFATAT